MLPWLLGAVMFGVYVLTLNHHLSPGNLASYSDIRGWDFTQRLAGPVTMLVLRPFALLPHSWVPLAMNLFSALCAALSLGMLARSVALLPHDRTHDQRENEPSEFSTFSGRLAWMPPVFAVLICGLQRSFWENSIEATGETFDLLIFAYLIRCLLEYRIDGQESWFTKFAVILGLGMANNWAMFGFFPAFLGAVLWIKGSKAFEPQFMVRTLLCGLAGFSLFLLYPILNSVSHYAHGGFWETLRATLVSDKRSLMALSREDFLVLSLTSLLPVFIMGIKWASYFGDNSPLGIFLATSIFHIVYAMFFLACLWVALDAPISPRARAIGFFEGSFLTFGYLGALSVGYFCGYFLVVFGSPLQKTTSALHPLQKALNYTITGCVVLLFLATPVLLAARSFPYIKQKKKVYLGYNNYIQETAESLPPKGGVLLSDDPFRLLYLQAWLDSGQKAGPYLFVETGALDREPTYLRQLREQRPDFGISLDWTNSPAGVSHRLVTMRVLQHLGSNHELYYIHGSFGYFFEGYYAEQNHFAYRLKPYPAEAWDAPLPTASQIAENQKFWKEEVDPSLPPLVDIVRPPNPDHKLSAWEKFNKSLHLKPERPLLAELLCSFYSRTANDWGVQLERAGRLPEAAALFEQATNVFEENFSARVNKTFNHELAAGRRFRVQPIPNLMEKLGRRGGWEEILGTDGPIDEPNFRLDLALAFANGGNERQAVQNLDRIHTIAPSNAFVTLQLAQLLVKIQKYTNEFSQFIPVERGYADAIGYADQVLAQIPRQPDALFLKSFALMQSGEFKQAIGPLDILLESQPANFKATLNRAIAEYKAGELDAAKSDYASALKLAPDNYQSYYGLGEIAFQQKDNYAAMKNYQLYLANSPGNPAEKKYVEDRLQELKNNGH